MATSAYYDTVNFARKLKVPGLYSWGYNDETSPPKIETGHTIVPEQRARVNRWIQEFLKTGKASVSAL